MTLYPSPKPERKKLVKAAIKNLDKPIFGMRKEILKEADTLWSKIVRNVKRCIWCQVRPSAHAHHIFSRKHYTTRHDMVNGAPLCAGCHLKAHTDSAIFHDFIEHYLGYESYQALKARVYIKGKKIDLRMRIIELQQIERLQKEKKQ